MNKEQAIYYVEHQHIDSEKWNRCLESASNSRVYALEWYLDRTAEYWDALVWGDYEFVMPLPIRTKYGIDYVYQPPFCQQLGIFPPPTAAVATVFYRMLIEKVKYSDVQINSSNSAIEMISEIDFIPRENFLLNLKDEYQNIVKSFTNNTRRNIARSNKNQLQWVNGIRLEEFMEFNKENSVPALSKKDFGCLQSIVAYSQYKGFGEIHGVYNAANKLCAAAYFCRWKDRVVYLDAVSTREGKEARAMFFLLDNFIRNQAGSNLKLDFEGSVIPGIARFYRGFGATPETYFQLKINRLPVLLKWIKRLRQ